VLIIASSDEKILGQRADSLPRYDANASQLSSNLELSVINEDDGKEPDRKVRAQVHLVRGRVVWPEASPGGVPSVRCFLEVQATAFQGTIVDSQCLERIGACKCIPP